MLRSIVIMCQFVCTQGVTASIFDWHADHMTNVQ